MNEKISILLKEYGLKDKEIVIYVYLVGNGETTAYDIARNTKIHKSTCYDILDKLISIGFVSRSGDIKKYYVANDILDVVGKVRSKGELLLSLVPELQSLETKQETFVKHLDSPDSYIEIDTKISELIKQRKLSYTYIIGNAPSLSSKSSMIFVEKLIREFSKLKIIKKMDCRGIWDKRFRNDPFMKQFNLVGENKFIDYLPTQVTTIIFNGYVAFLFLTEHPNVIEIKNNRISEEMKVYFEYLWKLSKK